MTRLTASRRRFLETLGAFGVLGSAAPLAFQLAAMNEASAQSATPVYKALVCLFKFGGNDSHNMLLATDQDSFGRYLSARNTGQDPIALMPPGAAAQALGAASTFAPNGRTVTRATPEFWGGALPIAPLTPNPIPAGTNASTRTFAIHPMMAPLVPVWDARRLAFVSNVGPLVVPTTKAQYQARSVPLPPNLMSHNDQQSIWQAGQAEGARLGWGGRMADLLLSQNGANALFTAVSTAGNAVFLAGNSAVQYQISTGAQPAIRVNAATGTSLFGSSQAPALIRQIIRDGGGPSLFGVDHSTVVGRSMDSADTLNQAFANAVVTGVPNPPVYTNPITGATETNALATQLQTVARMIAANATGLGLRRQVFFVSIGGWDNHDVQNTAQPALLARVAHAMAYFDSVLGNLAGQDFRNSVTTFTASDFSRTFTTNGDGTDHAWGGHYMAMGGAVLGQNIYGQYPTLGVDQGAFRNPDMSGNIQIPTTSVYQFASTLGRWLGVSDADMDVIFPRLAGFPTRVLPFL